MSSKGSEGNRIATYNNMDNKMTEKYLNMRKNVVPRNRWRRDNFGENDNQRVKGSVGMRSGLMARNT